MMYAGRKSRVQKIAHRRSGKKKVAGAFYLIVILRRSH